MKYSKYILEAIAKGINIALDNYEDDEIQVLKDSKLIDKNLTKEYIDLLDMTVDLGLPSGTLWCKCNLGATCENMPESWYGDYYAWGELTPNKDLWGEASYKFTGEMKKYNNYDKLINLLPEDDAAYLNMHLHNFKFHIPTKELCEELLNYTTTSEYQENYNRIEGLSGYILTSNINNNEIFIPMAGYYGRFRSNRATISCATRYERDSYNCYVLQCLGLNTGFILNNALYRPYGFPIRPVINLK